MSWDLNSTLLYLAPDFFAPTKLTETEVVPNKPWFKAVDRDVVFLVMVRSVPTLLPVIQQRYPSANVEMRVDPAGKPLLGVVRVPVNEVRHAELQLSQR
jgi:hypothetical protein